MPANTRSAQSCPHGAPAYYLASAMGENGREKARGSSLVTGPGRRAGWREASVAAGGPAVEEEEARS